MLITKETVFLFFCILSVGKAAVVRSLSFTDVQITELKNYLRDSGDGTREVDPSGTTGKLIQGKYRSDPEPINLSKHHIIPETDIRAGLRKMAIDNPEKLKSKLEQYFNDRNNIESKKLYLDLVRTNTDLNLIIDAIIRSISWNPNNLRVGPEGKTRKNDPESDFDNEIATDAEKRVYNDKSKTILQKLTSLKTSKNPTWVKNNGQWAVKDVQGSSLKTTQLLQTGSLRFFKIEEGWIVDELGNRV